jgi:hypothetical protein
MLMYVLVWGFAAVAVVLSVVLIVRVVQNDFQPRYHVRKALILAGILVCLPGFVLVFTYLPTHIAGILSIVMLAMATFNFVFVVPGQWHRIKRRLRDG